MKKKKSPMWKVFQAKDTSRTLCWVVLCDDNWLATFKHDFDAHDFVDRKTFQQWDITKGIEDASGAH